MMDRNQDYSYRRATLPDFRGWVLRVTGILSLTAAVLLGILARTAPTPGVLIAIAACVVTGSVLLALPEFLRYQMALRETPPLHGNVERAFDDLYAHVKELAEQNRQLVEDFEELEEKRMSAAESHDGEGNSEVEMALAELKLEHDDLVRKLEVLLEETEVGGGRELPPNLLAKALGNSGKGKGFPLGGGK